MRFRRYNKLDVFKADVLPLLLEDEVINNLLISIITDSNANSTAKPTADWLMATITDAEGKIALIVLCTKPYNILLYEPKNNRQKDSVELLACELRRIGFTPPGVLAESELARRFAKAYTGGGAGRLHMSAIIMRLDTLAGYNKSSGFCRMLTEEDLSFTPFWEQAFSVDCRVPASTLIENEERIRTRIGKDSHFIWEDGVPVSQAVFGRQTPNGAVVTWVYTPPLYRGRGYATSVVAELSRSLLDRGKSFCCLFADADNPASCKVYHRLGYYDVCRFEEIKFG